LEPGGLNVERSRVLLCGDGCLDSEIRTAREVPWDLQIQLPVLLRPYSMSIPSVMLVRVVGVQNELVPSLLCL